MLAYGEQLMRGFSELAKGTLETTGLVAEEFGSYASSWDRVTAFTTRWMVPELFCCFVVATRVPSLWTSSALLNIGTSGGRGHEQRRES